MEERIEVSILLDFYSELLTEKQREIMNMYYNEDFSLGEIAELTNTSRQAIHDLLKRCQKLLVEYEEKLQLKHKEDIQSASKKLILQKLELLLSKDIDNEITVGIEHIKKEIIENL